MSVEKTDDVLKLDNQLCFALYALSRQMTAQYRPILAVLGLTYTQYLVMLVLWEHVESINDKGLSVNQIGRRLKLDSGTLTPLLKRLQAAGLIHRERSQTDEREVIVWVSSAGKALKEKARSVPEQMMCLGDVSMDQIQALRQALEPFI